MAYMKGSKRGSNNCYARQRLLEEHLRSRRYPVTLAELAQFSGRHVRTVRRDLEALEEAGNVIQFYPNDMGTSEGERTSVRMLSRTFVDVQFTRGEAHLLAGTRRLWAPFAGTCLHDDMERIFTKIVESLPKAEREAIRGDAQRFYFVPEVGAHDYSGQREHIQVLQRAVLDRRQAVYGYRTVTGQWLSGTMEPHAFVVYKSTLYVLARRLPSARAIREGDASPTDWVRWPVDRFVHVKLGPDTFEVAPDFDIEAHFDGFGIIRAGEAAPVVVDFAPAVAPFVKERIWHHTQTLEPLADGWLRLSFATANLKEAQSWIQSFAGHAVVRAPQALRDAVLSQFARALALAAERAVLSDEVPAPEPPPPVVDVSSPPVAPHHKPHNEGALTDETSAVSSVSARPLAPR